MLSCTGRVLVVEVCKLSRRGTDPKSLKENLRMVETKC
jgi:hypothetical protein